MHAPLNKNVHKITARRVVAESSLLKKSRPD
jgi:hypothetical protein